MVRSTYFQGVPNVWVKYCCRHTRGTFLYGKTGEKALSMSWLGHSSERVHDKYLHTYEALMREIKSKDCDWGV